MESTDDDLPDGLELPPHTWGRPATATPAQVSVGGILALMALLLVLVVVRLPVWAPHTARPHQTPTRTVCTLAPARPDPLPSGTAPGVVSTTDPIQSHGPCGP